MNAQHRVALGGFFVALVVLYDELVVVLSPREDVVPMGQIVSDHGQSIAPRLHYRLHVVQRILVVLFQVFVDLVGLLQLNYKLRRLQIRQVDVADDVGQTSPLF